MAQAERARAIKYLLAEGSRWLLHRRRDTKKIRTQTNIFRNKQLWTNPPRSGFGMDQVSGWTRFWDGHVHDVCSGGWTFGLLCVKYVTRIYLLYSTRGSFMVRKLPGRGGNLRRLPWTSSYRLRYGNTRKRTSIYHDLLPARHCF